MVVIPADHDCVDTQKRIEYAFFPVTHMVGFILPISYVKYSVRAIYLFNNQTILKFA